MSRNVKTDWHLWNLGRVRKEEKKQSTKRYQNWIEKRFSQSHSLHQNQSNNRLWTNMAIAISITHHQTEDVTSWRFLLVILSSSFGAVVSVIVRFSFIDFVVPCWLLCIFSTCFLFDYVILYAFAVVTIKFRNFHVDISLVLMLDSIDLWFLWLVLVYVWFFGEKNDFEWNLQN